MAKKVEIDIEVNAEGGAKSLRALKDELKETQKTLDGLIPGTKAYRDALARVADVKDSIEDLNEEIAAFQGAGKFQAFSNVAGSLAGGFQAAQGAAALFGSESEAIEKTLLKVQAASALAEGIKSVEGMGQAFKSLGAVLKAHPIMLIATVVAGIGAALFALKDKFKPLGAMFDAIGDAIGFVVDKVKEFTDAIGLSNFEVTESYEKQIETVKKLRQETTDRYDFEIKKAQAAGKETFDLEVKKYQAAKDRITKEITLIALLAQATGGLTEEQKKAIEELKTELKKAAEEITVKAIAENKKKNDQIAADNKKHSEDEKKRREDESEANFQAALKERQFLEQAEAESEELGRIEKEKEEKAIADRERLADEAEAFRDRENARKKAKDEEAAKEEIARKAATKAALLSIEQSAFSSLQSIGELFIKDGEKLKKYQKGVALAQIAIDTGKAISSLVAASSANPFNSVTGGIAGVAQYAAGLAQILANVAKAKQIIESGNTSGGTGGSPSGGGQLQGTYTPTPSLNGVSNTQTQIDQNGQVQKQQAPIKAYVTETDITSSQNQVNRFENNSKF